MRNKEQLSITFARFRSTDSLEKFLLERLRGDSFISAPPDSRQCQELPFLCFSLSCPELEKTPHGNDMQCQFWSKNAFREEYEINFLRLLVLFSPKKYFPRKCLVFGRRLAKWVDWLVKPGEEAI